MERLIQFLKSKKTAKFMMYFSAFAFIFFIALVIDTLKRNGFMWQTVGLLFFALVAANSFLVCKNRL